jgi:hypothetical protein
MFQVDHVSLAKEANGFFGTILVSIYLHESHYISFEGEYSRYAVASLHFPPAKMTLLSHPNVLSTFFSRHLQTILSNILTPHFSSHTRFLHSRRRVIDASPSAILSVINSHIVLSQDVSSEQMFLLSHPHKLCPISIAEKYTCRRRPYAYELHTSALRWLSV